MKKIYSTAGRKKGVKTSHSNKNKLRRRKFGIIERSFERPAPEPSPFIKITETENGKTIEFKKWVGNKKQSEYTTDIAKNVMNENKRVKQSRKELIKKILMEAGYEPKKYYTCKEKKHFTRIVKNKLFAKPTPIKHLSDKEHKERFAKERLLKKAKLDNLPYMQLPVKKGKQRPISAEEATKKEKPDKRKFKYSIQRKSDENPIKNYDFLTDYFEASTRNEAYDKAKEIAKGYKRDTSFCGITVQDINGDNSIKYFPLSGLKAA